MKNIFLLILIFISSGNLLFSQTFTTPGTGGPNSYTPAAGVTCIFVQVWGAGGGSGGGGKKSGGGGGGGGGYSQGYIIVVPGTPINFTVGAGGTAGTAGGNVGGNGTNGGNSSFSTLTAVGGSRGLGGGNSAIGPGGPGGAGASQQAGGDGGNGGAGSNGAPGGGGGSSAGPGSVGFGGTNGTASIPGNGGIANPGGGNGGNGSLSAGNPGVSPGGGAGGGAHGFAGAAGGNGRVVITIPASNCPVLTAIAPSGAQSVCQASPVAALTATTTLSGGCVAPTISYQWYSRLVNNNTVAGATLIGGATSSTYTPPSAVIGTVYYFCVSYAAGAPCSQTNATQSLASNTVQISVTSSAAPTVANAGSNNSVCIGTAYVLTGNIPIVGTGTWSVVSGPSTLTSQFGNVNSSTSTFTEGGGAGVYVLRWTIANGSCTTPSTSNVTITVTCGGACPPCNIDYFQGTSGIVGSYASHCPVNTAGGNFYDDGGVSANYSHSINAIYRTFCPTTAGTCMRLTFNSFNTSNANDYMTISNGPAQNSPAIIQAPGDAAGRLFGNLNTSAPFSYTANNSSGCLSVRFTSNGPTLNEAGWAASITNVPCAAAGTPGNSDCAGATLVCSDGPLSSTSNGPGLVSEACGGGSCLSGESYSNWYTFTVATDGTLGLTITPTSAADYDFAIYSGNCSGPLERCSFSGVTGATGLLAGSGDTSEDATGDSFVDPIAVLAGETYYLMINSWTAGAPDYNLTWALTNGASLDCTPLPLPVELVEFEATYSAEEKAVDITWRTESELNNDYFTIEKSTDSENFQELGTVQGMGTTNETTQYIAYDRKVMPGYIYYRLKQTDFDGEYKYSEIRAVNVLFDSDNQMTVFPNPTTGKTEFVYYSYLEEASNLVITDARGMVIQSVYINSQKGENQIEVDLSNLANGVYFVTISNSTKVYNAKVYKI